MIITYYSKKMKKKKLTFDEIPSALVDIMDRLTTIEGLLKGQRAPKAQKAPKAPKKPRAVPVKEKTTRQVETLSADMASKLIGKAKITLYNLAKRGEIPARKEGRNWVFVEAELLKWLQERKPARKQRISRKSIKEQPDVVAQPVKRRGRKPKVVDVAATDQAPVEVVAVRKKRGRPSKKIVATLEPIKRRMGRRPRIVKKIR